jgi:translation elongation factor P/translation initiation factor 5A
VKGVYCTWDLNNASIEQVDGSNVVKLMRSGTLTSSVFENGVRSLAFTVKNGTEAVKVGLKVSTDGGSFAYLKNTDGKTQVDIKKNEEASLSYRDIPANSKIQVAMLSTKASAYCYVDNLEATFYDNEIPTGIKEVQGSEVMVNGYYNLNGQRVTKPSKGLYIVNGKKAVIK